MNYSKLSHYIPTTKKVNTFLLSLAIFTAFNACTPNRDWDSTDVKENRIENTNTWSNINRELIQQKLAQHQPDTTMPVLNKYFIDEELLQKIDSLWLDPEEVKNYHKKFVTEANSLFIQMNKKWGFTTQKYVTAIWELYNTNAKKDNTLMKYFSLRENHWDLGQLLEELGFIKDIKLLSNASHVTNWEYEESAPFLETEEQEIIKTSSATEVIEQLLLWLPDDIKKKIIDHMPSYVICSKTSKIQSVQWFYNGGKYIYVREFNGWVIRNELLHFYFEELEKIFGKEIDKNKKISITGTDMVVGRKYTFETNLLGIEQYLSNLTDLLSNEQSRVKRIFGDWFALIAGKKINNQHVSLRDINNLDENDDWGFLTAEAMQTYLGSLVTKNAHLWIQAESLSKKHWMWTPAHVDAMYELFKPYVTPELFIKFCAETGITLDAAQAIQQELWILNKN